MSRSAFALLATYAVTSTAHAAGPDPMHITVTTGLDDDIYKGPSGSGGVDATRLAMADFAGAVLGRPILVDAWSDHKKSSEVRALAARACNSGAGLLVNVQNAPTAAAVAKAAAQCRMTP